MKKLLLCGIAVLLLATGTAHAGDIPDGTMPFKIPPGFNESFPPLGYPRYCICMGEEPNGSRFMYPTYCVLDISKIPSTCIVPTDPKKPTPSIEKYTMRCGDIEAIVTVNRKYDDLGGFNKIDIYVADPKMIKQNETKGGYLYLNGELCTPTKIWTCPDKTPEGVC